MVIDTSILVAYGRRRQSVDDLVSEFSVLYPRQSLMISAITIAELTHGVYRSSTAQVSSRRQTFIHDLCKDVSVEPLTVAIAALVGKIEGPQASVGIAVDLPDLIIGATALHHAEPLLTLNPKHFSLIPGLTIHTPAPSAT